MAKEPQKEDEELTEEEIERRRDEALKWALATPHKPHKKEEQGKKRGIRKREE